MGNSHIKCQICNTVIDDKDYISCQFCKSAFHTSCYASNQRLLPDNRECVKCKRRIMITQSN